jgi:hypothetical protein
MSKQVIVKRSNVPGVYWDKSRQHWRAYGIRPDGTKLFLGIRKTMKEAEQLRINADHGIVPTATDKRLIMLDKLVRVRMRTVWRMVCAVKHGWKSFDDFVANVGDRPTGQVLVAANAEAPIGPDNFKWAPFDRNAYQRAHRAANLEHYRDMELRQRFGISLAEYRALMEEQNGGCAICGSPETAIRKGHLLPLSVDHNHTTGAIRGLLCSACNIGIGSLRESPDLLRKAIAYIEKWNAIETAPLPDNVVRLKD